MRENNRIAIEDAKLIYKNFSGKPTQYNKEGDRNFCVVLPKELADDLMRDGWNVKVLPATDEFPEEEYYMKVNVRFDPYPPIAYLITPRGKVRLDEGTINQLDWSLISNCDVIIQPYNYPALGTRPAGISAYLKAIYVTIEGNQFSEKYADIPDLN